MVEIRRIVTAQVNGKGVLANDGPAPDVFPIGSGIVVVDVWKTAEAPAKLPNHCEMSDSGRLAFGPPKQGTVFRLTEFPPDPEGGFDTEAAKEVFATLGAGGDPTATVVDGPNAFMHRTLTIDFGVVLEGEIALVLEGQEVLLRTGDVLVQQGANHAWSNRSGKPCRMAFVMVDATES